MTHPVTWSGRRWRSAVALAAVIVVTGMLSACCGAGTQRQLASPPSHPPRRTSELSLSHMVSIGERELAFYVTPGRLPAIVLDAGGGMDASQWTRLAPVIAAQTGSKVITYDRSGHGKSSYAPGPWSAERAAADLASGLRKLGITNDIVLVSHSLAGEVATYLVRQHPGLVSGAVLVDANLPQFYTDSETARIVAARKPKIAALKQKPRTDRIRQILALAANYGPAHRRYHELTWPGSVPATVIVSEQTPFSTQLDAKLWRAAQREFAQAAPNRRVVVAAHSSHDVPADRPDVVIQAVVDMLRKRR